MAPDDDDRPPLPSRVRDTATTRVNAASAAASAAAGRRVDAAARRLNAAQKRVESVGEAAAKAAERARHPFARRPRPDVSGWSAGELVAYLSSARTITPPLRAGHFAVRMTNGLGAALPVEATLLARAIADAAPPVGQEISPTLLDIVDRYLTDTLVAFRNSVGGAGVSTQARRLVVDQLRLLHQVTGDVQRAQAEHDDHELRVQEAFLQERFSLSTGNGLDLTPPPPPTLPHGATPVPRTAPHAGVSSPPLAGAEPSPPPGPGASPRGPGASPLGRGGSPLGRGGRLTGVGGNRSATRGGRSGETTSPATPATPGSLATSRSRAHHRLTGEGMPTGVFHPEPGSAGTLQVRLALPRGVIVTLTAVAERRTGATAFITARTKRLSARRKQAGFGSPQAEVTLSLELPEISRFIIVAATAPGSEPVDAVLFLTEGANSAELPTTLFRRGGATATVVASGHDTSDGLFLRNESTVFAALQDASTAYGYTGVTWISPDTPAV